MNNLTKLFLFKLIFLLGPNLALADSVLDKVSDHSLFLLAILMGSLDGFNVCSLGALILIISLVLVFKSRKLILIAGLSFIFTTVLVYGLLILIWHRIFTYILPWQNVFEIILGSIALAGGLYFLKIFIDAIRFGPTCTTQTSQLITRAIKKVESSFKQGGLWPIFTGTILFAAVITIVEFPCSAALPLTFVGLLTDAGTPFSLFAFYGFIYLLMYMLMEIIVFLVALFSKKIWLASPKLVTISSLLASLILLSIALQYLFGLTLF